MRTTLRELLAQFRPDESIFIPGSSAEPVAFIEALAKNTESLPPLDFYHSFIPGINSRPLAALSERFRETGFFPREQKATHPNARFLPVSYYGAMNYLRFQQDIDCVVLQLSPPDNQGNCSLGVAVEFLPVLLDKAGRVGERRQHFGDGDEAVGRKVTAALEAQLGVILCVGETESERDAEQTFARVGTQLDGSVRGHR